jgi:cellulose synthase/poly-beta-1,6-N-acetylglucosamine synthase-like glycosyltransferase
MDSSKPDAPPSYDANDAISTSTLSYGSSIQLKRPSTRTVFSWVRLGSRATVLSRIHNLVTSPNYTPSSVAPIVDSCAAALSVSQFSNLLQSLNIGGHTAMYWAIVKDRREVLSALVGYISQISSVCSDDLRLACMLVSDHILFMQLGLELEIGRECMPY